MRRIAWLATPIAVASMAAGIAVAGSGSSETTPVTADFEANLVKVKERSCDPSHSEFRLRFEGSQTSSDPRLTGDLVARVRSVVNTQTGWGYTLAKVTVSEPGGGKVKFHGRVIGVLEPDGGNEGFLLGRTVDRPKVKLLANFNVQQDPETGAITGEFGKDSQTGASQDPAVLTNACRGDKKKDDDDDKRGDDDRDDRDDDDREDDEGDDD
jgi:hypothetical protein